MGMFVCVRENHEPFCQYDNNLIIARWVSTVKKYHVKYIAKWTQANGLYYLVPHFLLEQNIVHINIHTLNTTGTVCQEHSSIPGIQLDPQCWPHTRWLLAAAGTTSVYALMRFTPVTSLVYTNWPLHSSVHVSAHISQSCSFPPGMW